EERLGVEVALTDLAKWGIERGYNRGDHDAMDSLYFNAVHSKKIAKQHPVLINGLSGDGCHTPVGHQQLVLARRISINSLTRIHLLHPGKHAEHGVCVADINDQQHSRIVSAVRTILT